LETPAQVTALTSSHSSVEQKKEAYKMYADTPFHVNARLRFNYSLPPVPAMTAAPMQMPANYMNPAARMNYPSQALQMQQAPHMPGFFHGLPQ
jgi:hypothetical protein